MFIPCLLGLGLGLGNWGVLPGIRDQKLREVQSWCLGVLREERLSLEGKGAPLSDLNLTQGCWGGLRERGLGCTLALPADWAASQLPANTSCVRKLFFYLSQGLLPVSFPFTLGFVGLSNNV